MEAGGDDGGKGGKAVAAAIVAGVGIIAAAAVGRKLFASRARRRVVGIIPARYASSRFPGKALALILGKPMIQRTWEQAMLATMLDAVVVATDDDRIADSCRRFGANVVMTSEACVNGTERCREALQKMKKYEIVVNIQGDEPLVDPEIINGVAKALQDTANTIYTDSQSALAVARNPVFYARTKHIEVHYHYVKERLLAGEISLAYVSTQDNFADLFTKALFREKLEAFRKALGLLPFVD
ncbi:hypothetical protein L7F22_057616 [Adiantum nelumboides]|nr:hypothetical protein [Adiantum nelumboides]